MTVTQRALSRRMGLLLSATLPMFIGCSDNAASPPGTGGMASVSVAGSGGSAGMPASAGSFATAGSSAGSVTAGTSAGGNSGGGGAGGSASAVGGSAGANVGGAAGGSGGMAGAAGSAGAAGAGGAACGTIDKAGDGSYVRTGWTAEYTCTGGTCPAKGQADTGDVDTKAFDGNYSTRWSTGVYQSKLDQQGRFPLMFTVDMKKSAMISKLSTHPGCQDIYDAPATIAVSVSMVGTTWTTVTPTPHAPVNPGNEACPPQANAKATDVITFPATCARYVRLTGTKRTIDDRYWAIGEMTVSP
jgi:hypothetical protein